MCPRLKLYVFDINSTPCMHLGALNPVKPMNLRLKLWAGGEPDWSYV